MIQALEAVQVILTVQAVEKATKRIPTNLINTHPYRVNALWTYYLRTEHEPKGESCVYCEMFDGQTFPGSFLRVMFPDHRWEGDDIYPDVHKTLWGISGTCACLLIREPDETNINLDMYGQITVDWKNSKPVEE